MSLNGIKSLFYEKLVVYYYSNKLTKNMVLGIPAPENAVCK